MPCRSCPVFYFPHVGYNHPLHLTWNECPAWFPMPKVASCLSKLLSLYSNPISSPLRGAWQSDATCRPWPHVRELIANAQKAGSCYGHPPFCYDHPPLCYGHPPFCSGHPLPVLSILIILSCNNIVNLRSLSLYVSRAPGSHSSWSDYFSFAPLQLIVLSPARLAPMCLFVCNFLFKLQCAHA
jgi:hypothetical protein